MVGAFLLGIVSLIGVVLVYILGCAMVRRFAGDRPHVMYHAVGQFILALMLDLVVIYFSVSFCTSSLKQALKLRGSTASNMLVDETMTRLGGTGDSLDIGSLWGLIVPIISWVCAHIVILSALLLVRYVVMAISRQTVRTATQGGADQRSAITHPLYYAAGALSLLGVGGYWFKKAVDFDRILIMFQIINSSKSLKVALGKDWLTAMSYHDLVQKLNDSFVGQVALHAGSFYVISLLVAGFAMVVTSHNLWAAMRRMPAGTPFRLPPLPERDPFEPPPAPILVGGPPVVGNVQTAQHNAGADRPPPADIEDNPGVEPGDDDTGAVPGGQGDIPVQPDDGPPNIELEEVHIPPSE